MTQNMSVIKKIALAASFLAVSLSAFAGSGIILRAPGNIPVPLPAYEDDVPINFGTADDVYCSYNTSQTPDSFLCGMGADSNAFILTQVADVGTDYTFADLGTTALVIQNADQTNVNKRIWFYHDGSNGIIETGVGDVSFPENINFTSGTSVIAGNYQIGRDSDATNQLHLNVPTGAAFEFSVNDGVEVTISSSQINMQNNAVVNLGSSGTDFTTTGTLVIGPTSSSSGSTALTINQPSHSAITTDRPSILTSAASMTLSSGTTISLASGVTFNPVTYLGVAGGSAETITDAFTLVISGPAVQGANATLTNLGSLLVDSGSSRFDGRVLESQGANIASAGDLTLGSDGNFWSITGNTTINAITKSGWTSGSQVCIEFTGSPIVSHNTAGGAGAAKIYLSGAANFSATADDILCLIYNGTVWKETSRTVI